MPEPTPDPTPRQAPRPTPQPASLPTAPPKDESAPLGARTPQPAPADTPDTTDMTDAPRALDLVRARFPRTPDQDAPGLAAHAEHLAAGRRQVDLAALRGRESALTFDPRSGAS